MYDVVIIGSGPAGLTAGLYAGRYRLKTVILEKAGIGGQIILSPSIENYPGFPGGIPTAELIERMHAQVRGVDIEVVTDEVLEVTASGTRPAVFTVKARGRVYESKSAIIATGAEARKLGARGEEKFIGRGVSYCATCDGPLFKGKEVAVIGGGDRALEEAIFLAEYCRKVTVIHRRKELRASAILQEKARAHSKISFFLGAVVSEVIGTKQVEGIQTRDVDSGVEQHVPCDGVFIFVGIQPATAFVKNLLHTDSDGFIITDHDMQSSAKGVFACGDCRKKSLYQVVSAASDGAMAAASAHRYLL